MIKSIYKIIFCLIIVLLFFNIILSNSSIYFKEKFQGFFSLRLNKQKLILTENEEFKIYVIGINKRVNFTIDNPKVADISITGKVTAKKVGTTIINAKVGNKKLKCKLRVIGLNSYDLKLKKGEKFKLNVKGINSYTKWKSKNKDIIKIDRKGNVKAIKSGRSYIIAKVKGKILKCKVKVI